MAKESFDTIIVGGGIAGLTSAAYLAREGQKVLLIEKNAVCGGLVNSFTRDGFHFDAGVRALEDAGIIFPMLEDLGINLEIVRSPVSVGVGKDILHIEDINSLKDYGDLLVKLYPDSEDEIAGFLKIIRKVMKHMEVLYGMENPIFKDLKNDRSFLFNKLLPWLPKFIFTIGKINRMNMPIEDYLKTVISDQSLRDIVSQHFFKNTPSFFALSYFTLYLDYFYPRGGVGVLVKALEDRVIEMGGEILTDTEITKVFAGEKYVKDQEDIVYKYDKLIWAADLKTLYSNTDTTGLSSSLLTRIEKVKKGMLNKRGGDSVYTLFVQVDKPIESFGQISNGHFFYTPSKTGLGEIHTTELKHLLDNWQSLKRDDILEWLDRFINLNTYEISIPGLKDKDLVPPGKTGLIISFLAEYDLFNKVKEAGWYDDFKEEIATRVLKLMTESIYPMLKDNVIKHFSYSPLSIKDRVNSSEGAITGWSFDNPVPVINKIQHVQRSVTTPFPGIFQAGQWTYSPGGVPMSILTGKLAADKITKKTSN